MSPTPDTQDIPKEHLWITHLIAIGMARADEEDAAFNRGGQQGASAEDVLVRTEYFQEAHEVLRATGRIEELSLMETLARGAPESLEKAMTVEDIESWIATREAKVSKIEQHLAAWERGSFQDRDADWADRAKRAAEGTMRQIRFGYKVRLALTRDPDPQNAIPALKSRVAQLETSRNAEKRKRIQQVEQQQVQMYALRKFVRENAPELMDAAFAAVDAARDAYDAAQKVTQQPDISRAADPEPSL